MKTASLYLAAMRYYMYLPASFKLEFLNFPTDHNKTLNLCKSISTQCGIWMSNRLTTNSCSSSPSSSSSPTSLLGFRFGLYNLAFKSYVLSSISVKFASKIFVYKSIRWTAHSHLYYIDLGIISRFEDLFSLCLAGYDGNIIN